MNIKRKRGERMLTEKKYKILLKIYLAIYPLFLLNFFYNSYFTLIQIAFLFAFFIYLLIINKKARKNIKYILIYFMLLFIYGIFHHFNALNFTSLVPGNFNYNWIKEALYILKMSMPVFFIYIIYYSKLERKDYLQIIKIWLIIICVSIIFTNLFKISKNSYTSMTIKYNLLSWFTKEISYKETASTGFFMYPNQISCLLVTMTPIILYFYFENKIKIFYLIILLLTFLLLGTRVASIGGILTFIGITLIYALFKIFKKEKFNWKKSISCLLLIIIYLVIFPFSPAYNRFKNNLLQDSPILIANSNNEVISNIKYIEENYKYKLINEEFILKSYPYQYDPNFWLKIMKKPISERTDYRYLEIEMVKRVKEINNNKLDNYFGITNTRIQNIFNIEKDYILQYYAFGLLGCILLLGSYIILFLKKLINIVKKFNFLNICLLASNFLILFIPYLSGNIYNQIAIFIPLIFIGSLNIMKNNENM